MRLQLSTNNRIIAKKSLGQNFIHNENFLIKLANNIVSNKNTDIIEIGPGTGSLTKHLQQKNSII